MDAKDVTVELARLSRIVRILIVVTCIVSIVSLGLGTLAMMKANAATTQLEKFRNQVDAEFAELGTNPAGYLQQAQSLDRALESAKTELRQKRENAK